MPRFHAAMTRLKKPSLWLAAIALVTTGIVWTIHRNGRMTVEQFIPLALEAIPAGLVVNSPVPSGVEIRLSGPRHALKPLAGSPLSCRIDLSRVSEGMVPVSLGQDCLKLPDGVDLLHVEPAHLTLKIARLIHKQVPVTVIFSGKPAPGYTVAQAVAEPTSILLSGPDSLIAPLEQAPTAALDISGANAEIRKPLTLDLPEGVTAAGPEKTITARIHIIETIGTKQFAGIAVSAKNAKGKARVTPATIDITVEGPVNILDRLEPQKGIDIHVDLTGLKPGVYVRRAVIGLPVKTTLRNARPELFTVTLSPPQKTASKKK